VKTAVLMEGQAQTDDHLDDKNKRLDAGRTTERYNAVEVIIPGINSFPVPKEDRS